MIGDIVYQQTSDKYGIVLNIIDGECDTYLTILWPDKIETVGCFEISTVT